MSVLLIFFLVIVGLVVWGIGASNQNAEREREIKRLAQEREARFEQNREVLRGELLLDWQFRSNMVIDSELGFVAMDIEGKRLRLVYCQREDADITISSDEVVPLTLVNSLSIDQPQKAKTITHTETTPVPVGSGRSPVGRAVVGGLVAGPAGLVVGGLSGLGGKSKIEEVTTKRHQTVYVKGHPKLVIGLNDLVRPRRVLIFDTVKETNDWSSRIFTAMNRARGQR